jgi:hypothetical protein
MDKFTLSFPHTGSIMMANAPSGDKKEENRRKK